MVEVIPHISIGMSSTLMSGRTAPALTARSMILEAGAAKAAFSYSIPSHSRSSTPIIASWNPASPSTAIADSVNSVATAS